YFNNYKVLEYPRRPEKVYSQIVHNIIVEHLPKEGFTIENHTPEEVINGAVPTSFIWSFTEQESSPVVDSTQQQNTLPDGKANASTQSGDIYNKLPDTTISGNVVKESWAILKNATKAISDKGVISTRIHNSTEHFGNPFSSDARVLANNSELTETSSTKESVEKYIDWVINSQDTRAKWVREQLKSGNLKGKPILYYTELNEPSHANALDYLINQYDWGNQQTNIANKPTSSTQTEAKGAVSDSLINTHLTVEDVKKILVERYGEGVVNALIKKGLLIIHQSLPNGFNTKGAKFSKNAESRDAAIRQAREAVRDLLLKLNFKFVESPNLDISELERIASKYITGLHNDDEIFLKEAAKALSYALYHDINGGDVKSVDKSIPRTEIETVIFYWLKNGTLPHNATSLWKRIIFTLKKLLGVFSGKLYESVSEKLEDTINKIITGESFSYTPKVGYEKLNFQKEMDNNPNAVSVLKSLVKSGQPFTLTGSVAYADQVPVYRDPNKPLHDVDLLFPQGKAEEVYQWFKKGDPNTWGDIVKLYEFTKEDKKVIGTAVVPAGHEIVNVKSFWNAQAKRPQRSYDVYSKETNTKVGSYFFLQGETEKFEGIAGITVDIMEDKGRKTVEQQFTDSEGKPLTIKVASYEGGFAAKLEMLREKDINDFKLVIPRDVTTQAKQSISANNKVEGFYQDGKVHLIADNLTAETVVATLVHELSGHLGFQEILDKDTYLALLNRFKQLVAEGDEVAIAAKKRAEAATDNPSEQESEYLPYLLSEYLTAKAKKGKLKSLFEAVVNGLKTAISNIFASSNIPTSISNNLIAKMTTSDIVYLAERMVSGISDAAKASINTFKEFTWARYSPNSYEVSTKGDKRFSALNARLKDGRTIEEAYQLDVKGYREDVNGVQDTNWRKGKNKPTINKITREQQWKEYKSLWEQYFQEKKKKKKEL
ncbi:MAG: hypothetical protein KDH96_08465, partial [Candidatus Riesia sp.]|nr:hypothetical protein [Candidatus Riesia sp.]